MASPPPLAVGLAGALTDLPSLAGRLRELPWPVTVALGLVGVGVLLAGARMRRPLAVAGGAALGWMAATAAPTWVSSNAGVSRGALAAAGAALLAVGGGLFPPLFVFAAGALPGAVLGASFPIKDTPELGCAAGAVVAGVAALLLAQWVAAAAASTFGAAMISMALVASASFWPALDVLSARPFAAVALAAVLAVAGTAFQSSSAWPPPGAKEKKAAKPASGEAPTVVGS